MAENDISYTAIAIVTSLIMVVIAPRDIAFIYVRGSFYTPKLFPQPLKSVIMSAIHISNYIFGLNT